MMNLCPCIEWVRKKLMSSGNAKKRAYEGTHEMEEEEFMNPQEREEDEKPVMSDIIEHPNSKNKAQKPIPLFTEDEKPEQ